MIVFTADPHPTNIDLVRVSVRCAECKSLNRFDVPEADWFKGCYARAHGATMQEAYPNLNPDQRELLISRICPRCFDAICHD